MTKAPTPTEKSRQYRDNIKNATKSFDYTTIADRLRKVSLKNKTNHLIWSNSHFSATANKAIHRLKIGGLQNQREHHIILTKNEAVHPTAVTEAKEKYRGVFILIFNINIIILIFNISSSLIFPHHGC